MGKSKDYVKDSDIANLGLQGGQKVRNKDGSPGL